MPGITVGTVLEWLDSFAPFDTAEAFDNVGLLVGDKNAPVSRILFCMDATQAVALEAERIGAELIIAHHPVMFGGIRRIDYAQPEGKALGDMLRAGLHMIAAHTNLDKAPGGTGDTLAQALGLAGVGPVDAYIRMGTLPAPLTLDELSAYACERLSAPIRAYGEGTAITRVAVGAGAYGEGAEAAYAAGAQAYVVGEIKHHEALAACQQGLAILDAGHYATEWPGVQALYQRFQTAAEEASWEATAVLFSHAPFTGALRA